MPHRPPAPCTWPGCPALVAGGGRCDQHQPKDQRPSPRRKGYDRRWEATRARYLDGHPTCEQPGCTRPATDVDHRDGLGPRGPRGHDPTNLQALCHPHHSRKTAMVDGGFGRPRRPPGGGGAG